MRNRGDVLAIIQFVLLALMFVPAPPLWQSTGTTVTAMVLVGCGLALATAGLVKLGSNIVPWVAPRAGAPLETGGIYRWTRNPIYLGIILGAGGWALWRARAELIVVWILLLVVLALKARVEQRYLLAAYGEDYRAYALQTPLILWGRGIR